ncbi:MAG: hypothetical protein AAGH40_14780 [Verrucomicrobiota bacterium]
MSEKKYVDLRKVFVGVTAIIASMHVVGGIGLLAEEFGAGGEVLATAVEYTEQTKNCELE